MSAALEEILQVNELTHSSVAQIYSKYVPYECHSVTGNDCWYDPVNRVSYTDDQMLTLLFKDLCNIQKDALSNKQMNNLNKLTTKQCQVGVLRQLKNLKFKQL